MLWSLWIPIFLMLVIGLSFVIVPYIRYQDETSKLTARADWYRNREQELSQELSAGKFTEQEYQQALTELKLTAKHELSQAQDEQNETHDKSSKSFRSWMIIATTLFVVGVVGFYAANGLYQKYSQREETLKSMPELSQRIIHGSDQAVTTKELSQFALGLRTKLAEKEDDIGWMLLGRVLMSLGDTEGGVDAFRKSFEMNPQNISNSISFAQALQYRGEDWDVRESIRVLQSVLSQQANNADALILFAEGNMIIEQFEVAIKAFQLSLDVLSSNDPRSPIISERISLLKNNGVQVESKQVVGSNLSLQVVISEQLSLDLAQFSHLFLFAKVDTMPMPIAVKRVKVTEFPMNLTLTDLDVMLPDQKLSQFAKVNLFARLSKDANAEFSEGEWQGSVLNVSSSAKELIKITINEGK